MQTVGLITLCLLATSVAADHSPEAPVPQPGQAQGPVPVGSAVVVQQPPVEASPVVQPSSVEQQQPPVAPQHHVGVHHQAPPASYYAPAAGMVTVVGGESKPVRNFEQYGQPEPASIPPNYKPFGSWGLYIGGNPADGYYTNFYKALSNSVDKQQVGPVDQVKPSGQVGASSQTAAFGPILRQASSSPYVGGDYYPFAYSPAELNSGARVPVEPPLHPASQHASVPGVAAPAAQSYGAPSSYDSNVLSYADSYATKKLGQSSYATKDVQREVATPVQVGASKGYQNRAGYVYSPVVHASAPVVPAPVSGQQQQQQQQVVAYPVPVGSQIVGSQPGVDGAFSPYGVHAFTRYAVKPALVNSDQSYYYSYASPVGQAPVYKQQYQYSAPVQAAYQPLSYYYGYPIGSQLHYSQGSIVPSGYQHHQSESPVVHHSSVQPQIEAASSEKSESEDKSQANKQQ